mmetsp:Transcript_13271/g.27333  ORF Transcript_13271/g.27333 Transcript_13271/m.27333 type:complete len:246 (+) Transcript_13271:174-911(+)
MGITPSVAAARRASAMPAVNHRVCVCVFSVCGWVRRSGEHLGEDLLVLLVRHTLLLPQLCRHSHNRLVAGVVQEQSLHVSFGVEQASEADESLCATEERLLAVRMHLKHFVACREAIGVVLYLVVACCQIEIARATHLLGGGLVVGIRDSVDVLERLHRRRVQPESAPDVSCLERLVPAPLESVAVLLFLEIQHLVRARGGLHFIKRHVVLDHVPRADPVLHTVLAVPVLGLHHHMCCLPRHHVL